MFCKDLSLVDYSLHSMQCIPLFPCFGPCRLFPTMCEADYTVNSFVQKTQFPFGCTCWIFLPRLERHNLYFLSGSSVTKLRFAQGVYDICSRFAIFIGLNTRDGRPAPRGTLPAGRGGFPAPPRPVKMIKTAGKLRGKIKARISTFSKRGNK